MYSMVVLMAMSGSVEIVDRGGCRGCNGCRGCHGCRGYCGGCYGGGWCHGCYGGGCYGGGCYGGGCHGCGGVIVVPGGGGKGGEKGTKTGAIEDQNSGAVGSGARLEIKLPTAGQVVIDDYTVPHTSTTHTYITAPLSDGEKRNITLKAGDVTKTVTVTAGQTLTVEMVADKAGVASK